MAEEEKHVGESGEMSEGNIFLPFSSWYSSGLG